ncbi:MAG: hypothetical protein HC880_17635 [Bacteroidia bacterium]|nr:hypothetical protein [Bacteroidia bacterium]
MTKQFIFNFLIGLLGLAFISSCGGGEDTPPAPTLQEIIQKVWILGTVNPDDFDQVTLTFTSNTATLVTDGENVFANAGYTVNETTRVITVSTTPNFVLNVTEATANRLRFSITINDPKVGDQTYNFDLVPQ